MAEKRQPHDENVGHFINLSRPPRKRQQHIIQSITDAARKATQKQWEEEAGAWPGAWAEALAQIQHDEEAQRKAEATYRITQMLGAAKAAGYWTLHEFLSELITTKDQHQSSQVSQRLIFHGHELLNLIRKIQPEMVSQWISKAHCLHPWWQDIGCNRQELRGYRLVKRCVGGTETAGRLEVGPRFLRVRHGATR
ncbi:hypothetical protein DFH08DRAFT_816897 [Mycena albidolilacea]|uniref:Uncharacterized protein n=1 Tax=Mycena albidolilacea TaxID=1033008 RepID=A0AAD6ZKC0_9AGAR|nr:hypothetical protein DFH08DRAFT_816897 [Mycena albidolilacea]